MTLRIKMAIAVCALIPGVALAFPPPQPTAVTTTFLANNTGSKAALAGDGIGAVFGPSLATRDGEATMRDFVEKFLITDDNVDILGARGVDGADLAYQHDMLISNDKFHVFTYNQTVEEEDDLSMHGGFIKVVVLTGTPDKIVHTAPHSSTSRPATCRTVRKRRRMPSIP